MAFVSLSLGACVCAWYCLFVILFSKVTKGIKKKGGGGAGVEEMLLLMLMLTPSVSHVNLCSPAFCWAQETSSVTLNPDMLSLFFTKIGTFAPLPVCVCVREREQE